MIEGARQLPTHHITIRVPWHDNGWNGTVCNDPCANTSCTVLPRVAENRDDALETRFAGQKLENFAYGQLPPCVDERGTFMSPFPLSLVKSHPYKFSAELTHGHFDNTPYTIQPYSAAAVPYRWMLREHIEGNEKRNIPSKVESLRIDYDALREPDLSVNPGWTTDSSTWVQEGTNQRVILDTFFGAIRPNESLAFFYAKRTPLAEDSRRVIVGVGRVKSISGNTEYRYIGDSIPPDKLTGHLWERNIEHSIRPGDNKSEGFILPYSELLQLANEDDGIDLTSCTAFSPDEYFEQYSYGSELLQQDGAIASLLALEKAMKAMRKLLDAPWNEYLDWIDVELNRLWKLRGAFPGFGAALHAFGVPNANLLAWHIVGQEERQADPWPKLSMVLEDASSLPDHLGEGIGPILKNKWMNLPCKRRALLKLLARFNLTNDQALRWYQETERSNAGIEASDTSILENPYRIYEDDRLAVDPIRFPVIDRGMFPPEEIRASSPIPIPSNIRETIDPRRVRAAMVQTLEEAAEDGHTILPSDWLIHRVRTASLKPSCPVDSDTLAVIGDHLKPLLEKISLGENTLAYQLDRYIATSRLVGTTVAKRKKGREHEGEFNWIDLVNEAIDSGKDTSTSLSEDDRRARQEKAEALKVLYKSRVAVLIGSAGTGKTTLVKALCGIESVIEGGVLLLAPTGKARVRLEEESAMNGQGKTVAQFLNGLNRYDGNTGRYYINESAPRSSAHKTVVIDECSMLTEEQLAAVLDAIRGVDRLVLVGDPRQLPPIGAGRPYVDIVKFLEPPNIDSLNPKVAPGYAELTVTMRQQSREGNERLDVLLANSFSGQLEDAGYDEVWDLVAKGESSNVKLIRWSRPDQIQKLLMAQLVDELNLESTEDEVGFEVSLGGHPSEYQGSVNVWFNTKSENRPGAAEKAEKWQILTPVRQHLAGVLALNRVIQQNFRKHFVDRANGLIERRKTICSPAGPEGIVYGDKVINVTNSRFRRTYPKKDDGYVANGDIGIVTGHRRTKKKNWKPEEVEVEMASKPGVVFKYREREFDRQESNPPLELAYALTIHKTQGSEFTTTFLVVPNPCRMLSREMLYTALTRHVDKVVLLHQGDFRDLKRYAGAEASEVARRMTNLFVMSQPIQIEVANKTLFLDDNLIYLTERGELVRSKSEWIIADKLHSAGIDYQYEQPLTLGGIEWLPDFTIVDDDSGERWYWEHNGLLSNAKYRARWERKLNAYRRSGILTLDEGGGTNGTLLITEEKEGQSLDATKIERNIRAIRG